MEYQQVNEAIFRRPGVVGHYVGFDQLYAKEQQIIAEYYSDAESLMVLDIGCGTGRIAAALAAQGHEVKGVDLSAELIDQAAKLHPSLSFHVADAKQLPFDDATFDHVWFAYNGLDFIYPYANRLNALTEMYRVLKPGGLAIFSSHNSLCFVTTRRSRWKDIGRNVVNGRLFGQYRRIVSDAEGPAYIFHQHPGQQQQVLARLGFDQVSVVSTYTEPWRQYLSDSWPYYVARKPIS